MIILPSEYQRVEWIKSNGNAYIDAGIYITTDIGFEITANIPSGIQGALLGNYLPGSYFFFVYTYSDNRTVLFPAKSASTVAMSVPRATKTTFSFKNGVLDDGTTKTIISSYATSELGQPIYLFTGRPNNWFTSYTLYECKIYHGLKVVNDLIPCYRKSDNEIGLYDIVEKRFYSNANSVGYFEKGSDVNVVKTKVKLNIVNNNNAKTVKASVLDYFGSRLPSEYQEVEYVESSGTQYIDTGVMLSSSDTVKCKFEMTASTYSWADAIYGCSNGTEFFVLLMRSPTQARVGTGSNQASSTNYELNKIYDTSLTNGTYIENGTTYTFTPHTGFTNLPSCCVMFRNQGYNPVPVSAKVYSFEIEGKFNGIPCYRKADGVIGMYDTVSETFFTNAGTGTFTKGNDVYSLSYKKVQAYTLRDIIG